MVRSKTKRQVIRNQVFLSEDLQGKDFFETEFVGCRFNGQSFRFVQFDNCVLRACDFSSSQMEITSFSHCVFPDSKMSFLNFSDVTFENCDFSQTVMENCLFDKNPTLNKPGKIDLRSCNFQETQLKQSVFRHCNLQGVHFNGKNMEEVSFEK